MTTGSLFEIPRFGNRQRQTDNMITVTWARVNK